MLEIWEWGNFWLNGGAGEIGAEISSISHSMTQMVQFRYGNVIKTRTILIPDLVVHIVQQK